MSRLIDSLTDLPWYGEVYRSGSIYYRLDEAGKRIALRQEFAITQHEIDRDEALDSIGWFG